MSKPFHILHIDDDPFAHDKFKSTIHASIHDDLKISYSPNVENIESYCSANVKLVICDYDLGNAGPISAEQVNDLRRSLPNAYLVAMTMFDRAAVVRELMDYGFDQVICKKDSPEIIIAVVQRLLVRHCARPTEAKTIEAFTGATIDSIRSRIPRLLESALTSFHIHGESGTGKEVVADLFNQSLKTTTPFIRVNCAAIAPNLLHAELFGYIRGAFTGATQNKRGLIEAANGGFLFLDEIALLPLDAQAALLRALENGEIRRVGSDSNIPVKFRVISATNESLNELVRGGKFRLDLWQRLREVEIELLPLRKRREEIPTIIKSLMQTEDLKRFRITASAINLLSSLEWSNGNVRELRNCLRAMTENHQDHWLVPTSIPGMFFRRTNVERERTAELESTSRAVSSGTHTDASIPQKIFAGQNSVDIDFESLCGMTLLRYMEERAVNGPTSLRKTASSLGISRTSLTHRLRFLLKRGMTSGDHLKTLTGTTFAAQ